MSASERVMDAIELLQVLARHESRRQSLRHALDRIPREIKDLERKLVEERAVLDGAIAEREALKKRRRELESVNQDLLEERRKFESHLPQIKKNEEYRAALSQIDFLKEKISKNEDAILMTFEEEDGVSERLSRAQEVFGRSEQRLNGRKAELEAEFTRSSDELSALDAACKTLVAALPADLAHRYEQISASKEAAVAIVSGGSCGGCFTSLTPQVLNELRDGRRYHACDNCGRIVIWEEGTPA